MSLFTFFTCVTVHTHLHFQHHNDHDVQVRNVGPASSPRQQMSRLLPEPEKLPLQVKASAISINNQNYYKTRFEKLEAVAAYKKSAKPLPCNNTAAAWGAK